MPNSAIVQAQIDSAHEECRYAKRNDSVSVTCRREQVDFAHVEATAMNEEFEALADQIYDWEWAEAREENEFRSFH